MILTSRIFCRPLVSRVGCSLHVAGMRKQNSRINIRERLFSGIKVPGSSGVLVCWEVVCKREGLVITPLPLVQNQQAALTYNLSR